MCVCVSVCVSVSVCVCERERERRVCVHVCEKKGTFFDFVDAVAQLCHERFHLRSVVLRSAHATAQNRAVQYNTVHNN